jgi:hypothetical protein
MRIGLFSIVGILILIAVYYAGKNSFVEGLIGAVRGG